jgi:hypothetical protein
LREWEREAGAAEEDHGSEGLSGLEAVGAVGEEADFVVHAFEGSVGEAIAEEVEDTVEVELDGRSDAAEGLEA